MRSEKEIREKFNDLRGYLKACSFNGIKVMDVKRLIDEFETWIFKEDKSNAETRADE